MSKTLHEIAAAEIAAKKEAASREAEAQMCREAAAAYQSAWQRFVDACSLHWSDDEASQAIATLAGMLRQRDLRTRLEEAAEQHKSHRRKSFLVELLIGAYDGKADGAQLNVAREWGLDPHLGLSDEADSVREGIMFGFSPPPKQEPTRPPTMPTMDATAETKGEERGNQKSKVRLSHWAIAVAEASREWRLFQWFGNKQRWCERGLATVPQGRPAKLAEAFATNGGFISKADAIRLFQIDERRSWPPSKVFNSVCKRARMDLATAVSSDIARVTQADITSDPIPWNRKTCAWRCAIQVGYCCRDDRNELRFRLAEQIVDGFTEEEMRPG